MGRRTRTNSAGAMLLSALLALLVASPFPTAGRGSLPPVAALREKSADLAPALGVDGTFRGAPGVAGTVDSSAWTLVSDLAAGEAPRFAPAAMASGASPSAAGPWSALGSNGSGDGAIQGGGSVGALAFSGTDLYVGGSFLNAAGIPEADYIAKWDGSAWSALGSNGQGNGAIYFSDGWDPTVMALAVSGTDLYVGGIFNNVAGLPYADDIVKWNGSAWSALGSNGQGNGAIAGIYVDALAVSGNNLYVGGAFSDAGGIPEADDIAKWNGSAWSALGSNGAGNGAIQGDVVWTLAVSGNDLYAGGNFRNAAGIPEADYIAKWNGSAWSALGSNGSGNGAIQGAGRLVEALAFFGTDLYVGGGFVDAGGVAEADGIAKWNGSAWSALGSNGSGDGAIQAIVATLAFSGTDLYVGGDFVDAGGVAEADYIAKWNGSAWSALGSNGSGDGAIHGYGVRAVAFSGTDLYVGGSFWDAAGIPEADHVAKWGLESTPAPSGASCTPGSTSSATSLSSGATVDCTFTAGTGATFGGWSASGLTPTSATSAVSTFTAGLAGPASITATYSDSAGPHAVTFDYDIVADPPDLGQSGLSLAAGQPLLVPADGVARTRLQLTLRDAGGAAMPGRGFTVTKRAPDGFTKTPAKQAYKHATVTGSFTTDSTGVATLTLSGTQPGPLELTIRDSLTGTSLAFPLRVELTRKVVVVIQGFTSSLKARKHSWGSPSNKATLFGWLTSKGYRVEAYPSTSADGGATVLDMSWSASPCTPGAASSDCVATIQTVGKDVWWKPKDYDIGGLSSAGSVLREQVIHVWDQRLENTLVTYDQRLAAARGIHASFTVIGHSMGGQVAVLMLTAALGDPYQLARPGLLRAVVSIDGAINWETDSGPTGITWQTNPDKLCKTKPNVQTVYGADEAASNKTIVGLAYQELTTQTVVITNKNDSVVPPNVALLPGARSFDGYLGFLYAGYGSTSRGDCGHSVLLSSQSPPVVRKQGDGKTVKFPLITDVLANERYLGTVAAN